uniref:Nuclear pore complex protein Nup85 n=1 Tax=Lactuca sativa TaxID=4236 RepID=A0A9R1VL44_LACSA|nr:hypothetical protein LSAT_V11C500233270 [Lactuca sativa]
MGTSNHTDNGFLVVLLQEQTECLQILHQNPKSKYVLEYSKEINSLLGNRKSSPSSLFEDPKTVLKIDEEPSSLKAGWELLEIFYANKQSQSWIPKQLVDWLTVD